MHPGMMPFRSDSLDSVGSFGNPQNPKPPSRFNVLKALTFTRYYNCKTMQQQNIHCTHMIKRACKYKKDVQVEASVKIGLSSSIVNLIPIHNTPRVTNYSPAHGIYPVFLIFIAVCDEKHYAICSRYFKCTRLVDCIFCTLD